MKPATLKKSIITGCLILFIAAVFLSNYSFGQKHPVAGKTIDVGVARIDITPEFPIRLAGYGSRGDIETDSVLQRLEGKAIAFGSDSENPSIIITVDLLGITTRIRTKVIEGLTKQAAINPAQVVICASHTHGGPEIGNSINILQYREETGGSDSLLPLDQLIHIARYTEALADKLVQVSLAALKDRQPSYVAWGQGQAHFAWNRRPLGGPVDVALPMLRVTDTEGKLKAVFLNYACHGTTFEGINVINADWIGEAKRLIEEKHPGCMALVALGCGADADPKPRGTLEDVQKNGQDISDNIDKLLTAQLEPLSSAPTGRLKWVELPFARVPTIPQLIELTKGKPNTLIPYYARLSLDRMVRGEHLPSQVALPVQVWDFGGKMAMINLGGEVVVDYAIRLKNEWGADRLWVNAYSNDVPCYIASRRVIREGGYEAETSMPCYDKPSPLSEEAEDILINAVNELMPSSFTATKDTINQQETIEATGNMVIHLEAGKAATMGPNVKYMPEWKAFGWFTTVDSAEWKINVTKAGKYDVYLDYSVSDDEAGKSFLLQTGTRKIKGKIAKTGSWYTYAKRKIGVINLPTGPQLILFRSNSSSEKGAMLDLREIVLVPTGTDLNKQEPQDDFTILFDGKNLDQWVGNKTDYVIENGNIALHPENKGGGNLYTKNEYSNFDFQFEFNLTPGGNNGVGIRAPLTGDAAYVGMEIQILDDNAEVYKDLLDYQFHGSVYGVIPAKRGHLKPAGEWNTEQIIAKGDQIKVILNGVTILDGNISQASANGTLDHKQHPGLKNKKGHVGFLWHDTPIQFRNIRIKELK